MKVSKDGNKEWIVVKRRRKRTCKRKDDESEPLSTTDDSGKVKFAIKGSLLQSERWNSRREDPKRQHNAVMEVDTYNSKPYF